MNTTTDSRVDRSSLPIAALSVAVVLTVGLMTADCVLIWKMQKDFRDIVDVEFKLQRLRGTIVHLDEVLTMSSRLAASTGDTEWERRYREYEPLLGRTIKQAIELAPETYNGEAAAQTDIANIKLVEMENHAFELVRRGQQIEASALLLSPNYMEQKQAYSDGVERLTASIDEHISRGVTRHRKYLVVAITFAAIGLLVLLSIWVGVLRLVLRHITDRKRAEVLLENAHRKLESRVAERTDELTVANRHLESEIAKREAAAVELKTSEKRIRSIIENAQDAFIAINNQGVITDWNPKSEETFGWSQSEALGRPLAELVIPEQYRELHRQGLMNFLATGKGRVLGKLLEMTGLNRDGQEIPLELTISGIQVGSSYIFAAFLRNISDRKRAEEQLKTEERLLRRLLDIQEQERRMVAHDIHDGFVQYVVAAQMHMQTTSPTNVNKSKDHVASLLQKAITEGRRMINDLRPMVLDDEGVVEAIIHLIADEETFASLTVAFDQDVQFDRLDPRLEGVVYRIVQEALNNVQKHGQTDRASVQLKHQHDMLEIVVRDDGVGFDSAKVPADRFGLRGIRERARLFGGTARIESTPGEGTTVYARLRIDDELKVDAIAE
jgi:PAS domain S-box-containing protein